MRSAWVSTGVLTLALIAACSDNDAKSSTVEVGSVRADIQGGTTDTSHNYAVGVCMGPGPGRCDGICSGALIAPNLIATARHCVSESPEIIDCTSDPTFGADHAASSYWITTNTVMAGDGVDTVNGWYRGTQIFTPPDDHVCGNDIALIQIDSLVPSSVATPITPGVQHQMWDSRYYSRSYTAIGYGLPQPESTSGSTSLDGAGTRRIITSVPVECVPDSTTQLACPSGFNAGEFVGGDGTCQGDSGSSALDTTSFNSGTPVSFGVLSRGGESTDGTTCQGSLYSRFDAHRDFIIQSATTASSNWTLYPEPTWTGPADSPPVTVTADSGTGGGTALGDACDTSSDCTSNLCAQVESGSGSTQICTSACTAATTCTSGFSCQSGYCLKADGSTGDAGAGSDAGLTTETIVTKSGCSISPANSASHGLGWMAGLGLALVTVLRRRQARADRTAP